MRSPPSPRAVLNGREGGANAMLAGRDWSAVLRERGMGAVCWSAERSTRGTWFCWAPSEDILENAKEGGREEKREGEGGENSKGKKLLLWKWVGSSTCMCGCRDPGKGLASASYLGIEISPVSSRQPTNSHPATLFALNQNQSNFLQYQSRQKSPWVTLLTCGLSVFGVVRSIAARRIKLLPSMSYHIV